MSHELTRQHKFKLVYLVFPVS